MNWSLCCLHCYVVLQADYQQSADWYTRKFTLTYAFPPSVSFRCHHKLVPQFTRQRRRLSGFSGTLVFLRHWVMNWAGFSIQSDKYNNGRLHFTGSSCSRLDGCDPCQLVWRRRRTGYGSTASVLCCRFKSSHRSGCRQTSRQHDVGFGRPNCSRRKAFWIPN